MPVPFNLTYVGPRGDRIDVILTRQSDNLRQEISLCFVDQIENLTCEPPPNVFDISRPIMPGTWVAVPRVIRNGVTETGSSVTFTVEQAPLASVGPVRLSSVEPNLAAARILLRDAILDASGTETSPALYSESDTVRIIGENLAENQFLKVYLAVRPFNEPTLQTDSALPFVDWCKFEAEIISRGQIPGSSESFLEVRLPELPATTPSLCTTPPLPEGSIFGLEWRWVIRDPWIRPEREHTTWAINTPRVGRPWTNAPSFTVRKPQYPLIDGFGFDNHGTDASYKEFLSVYGNNAYHCVDCVPFVGCACLLPRIPDPLYHILWYQIYKLYIDETNGSCNGMSATSLLMARNELDTEQFDTRVHHPAGFTRAGDPSTYTDTIFCTPFCSPPKPDKPVGSYPHEPRRSILN